MRIALVQINPTVGDIAGNVQRVRDGIRRAREAGARLAVFPELVLLGYPPRDLLLKSGLVEANLDALASVAAETRGIAALVGYVDRNPAPVGRPLTNAVALLDGGEVVARKQKTLLPTYDVFDEARYFEPGPPVKVVELDGLRLGLTICEDLWNADDPRGRREYAEDPLADLAAQAPDAVVNVSASPFVVEKYDVRLGLLRRLAVEHHLPVAYCNQVGGNDELVFDGASLALGAEGRLLAQCRDFEEDLAVFEFAGPDTAAPSAVGSAPRAGVASVRAALVLGLRDYFRKCGFSDAVLGLSGGIDSAVVACLAAEALGPEHVMAVGLPSRYSASRSTDDARRLAENLGVEFRVIPIEEIHREFEGALGEAFAGLPADSTEENIQARVRGVLLMALANKFHRLLLATGNKSELAVGYCTLYGDMCGGLAPIGDVPKTLVYQLARHINERAEIIPASILQRPPTAELKPGQVDQDTLPPYDVLDRAVELYVEELLPVEKIVEAGVDRETAEEIVRRIDRTEYKRRQAPPVLKVTGRAFGSGRRLPVAQHYRPMS